MEHNNNTTCGDCGSDKYDHLIAGGVTLGFSILVYLLYIPCLKIMRTDQELCNSACYKIMFNMGVADAIEQSIIGVCGGIFTIIQTSGSYWFKKTLGAIACGTWNGYSIQASVLAFNRFVEVCFPTKADFIFSRKSTRAYLAFTWFYAFIHFVLLMIPKMSILHYPEAYFWSYERSHESVMLAWVHFVNNTSVILSMVLCYTGIVIRLKIQIQRLSGRSQLTRLQRQVTVQAVLICNTILLGYLVWFILPPLIPNNKWMMYTCGWMWVINCGVNPFIYLGFSSKIRQQFLIMFGLQKPEALIASRNTSRTAPSTLAIATEADKKTSVNKKTEDETNAAAIIVL